MRIKDMGNPKMNLGSDDAVKIEPTTDTGSGQVQDKQKVLLQELIAAPAATRRPR